MAEKEKSIGALWLNKSAKGVSYFSGVVEIDGKKTSVVIFKNTFKEEDKHPDYKIYESKPKESKPAAKQESFSDDIPF